MTSTYAPIDFPHGAELTVVRPTGATAYNKLGDRMDTEVSHQIGPCSIIDSHGQVNHADDGTARWVGTVDVEAPPDTDITVTDRVILPNGDTAMVVKPPERPRNPFTGWVPFTKFTLSSPGLTPAH